MYESMKNSIKLIDFLIAHTKQEVDAIIGRSVLWVDKTYFPRSGYNFYVTLSYRCYQDYIQYFPSLLGTWYNSLF